jgi:hypothetical protein
VWRLGKAQAQYGLLPARALSSLVSLAQVAVYARGLRADGYAASQGAIAALGLLLLFGDCGLTIWTTREVVRDPDSRVVRSAVSTRLVWFVLIYAALVGALVGGSSSAHAEAVDLICLTPYGCAFAMRTQAYGFLRVKYGGIPEGWIGPVTNSIESAVAIGAFEFGHSIETSLISMSAIGLLDSVIILVAAARVLPKGLLRWGRLRPSLLPRAMGPGFLPTASGSGTKWQLFILGTIAAGLHGVSLTWVLTAFRIEDSVFQVLILLFVIPAHVAAARGTPSAFLVRDQIISFALLAV